MILLPTMVLGEGFHTLELKNTSINFYVLITSYTDEINLKMKKEV